MNPHVLAPFLPVPLERPNEQMATDGSVFGVRVVPELLFQLGCRRHQGFDGAPFALAEINPPVPPQSKLRAGNRPWD